MSLSTSLLMQNYKIDCSLHLTFRSSSPCQPVEASAGLACFADMACCDKQITTAGPGN
jgi:hypothetical protein